MTQPPPAVNPFRRAVFMKSALLLNDCPADGGREVAFCGRSNAGKSSAINTLTESARLARTSKTPGRTQLLNFFALNESARLVDLPGYGYAQTSKEIQAHWKRHLDHYLRERLSLVGLVLVMDIRHPLRPFDWMMLEWAQARVLPVCILLTKADKLSRNQAQQSRLKVLKSLAEVNISEQVNVQCFSTLSREGMAELIALLKGWLALDGPPSDGEESGPHG
ncbi:MAG: YihA family ribosome biogenesis GTP-binding protein [Pseudomonadales bacterium]|nr:YihA family ribosome biogenesis GTP-binding protein [Pseudomonadales bacterium]MCC6528774.1 YihA family ribosome biogenesis GTP-binding protein [Pseudomonadales bacterium]MCP5331870.1 YihA family ribosome biogenesis GTP-binding protein [Pseudomonadales bacterium]HMU89848.1 ribosome biogenesis GTP-binding protein YihA/YsxC [Pseudomonadales bacterium]HMW14920.1 ribosome biogenesis GTP-binding protein YihA/YsxC [Pseudomonadales bacterium]